MTVSDPAAGTVLVVDDEPSVAELYAHYLDDDNDVTTVHDGAGALEEVDDSYDVVLLDRRMPEYTGDEVLAEIRRRNYDVRVAMVTAVDPDFDVAGLPCDDYLVKSVDREELVETVDRLLTVAEADEKRRRLSAMKVRRNVLAVEKSNGELERSEEVAELERRIDRLESELNAVTDRLETAE